MRTLQAQSIGGTRAPYTNAPTMFEAVKPVKELHVSPAIAAKLALPNSANNANQSQKYISTYSTSNKKFDELPQKLPTFGLGGADACEASDLQRKTGKRQYVSGPHLQHPMFDPDTHHPTSLNIGHYHGDMRIHDPPTAN